MEPQRPLREPERGQLRLLPQPARGRPQPWSSRHVKGTQFFQPLFEFSGACAGCGETPTSSCSPSSSATGCSSPTPPAARRSTAATCRRTPYAQDRERPRPGLVELAVRGQRRVRLRLPPGRRQATRSRRTNCSRKHGGPDRRRPRRARSLGADQATEAGIARPARARRRAAQEAGRRSPTFEAPAARRDSPTTWSARASGSSAATAGPTTSATAASTTCSPRAATSTSWCSTPRCTRTPAARRRRPRRSARSAKFAAGRQAAAEEGPRHDRHDLRQRLRRARRVGRQGRADGQGVPRGRVLRRPVAHHRLSATASRTATTSSRASTSRSWRWTAATGRCTASTRAGRRSGENPLQLDSRRAEGRRRALHGQRDPLPRRAAAEPGALRRRCSAAAQREVTMRYGLYEQMAKMHYANGKTAGSAE